MSQITIGILARAADVNVETVRFYERKGLVERPIRPRDGGYRNYPEAAIDRIRFIREAQGLGFSLAEIGGLLSLRTDPSSDCGWVRSAAEEKRVEVVNKINRLKRIRTALDQLIEACPGKGDISQCTILDALSDQKGIDKSQKGVSSGD